LEGMVTMKRFLFFATLCFVLGHTSNAQVIQSKSCQRDAEGNIMPCHFDHPTVTGDLQVRLVVGGCNPNINDTVVGCSEVSDTQGNSWSAAVSGIAPQSNGVFVQYALNTKGGDNTITGRGWFAIIAEYPPSSGLDDANYGTYNGQNHGDDQQGQSSDFGVTMPVLTSQSGDLLISCEINGSSPNNLYTPTPGPGFTIRESEYGMFALEDSWASGPGMYMASIHWNTYGHWAMSVAAFKAK
jgi:hypothetical protein